MGPGFKIGGVVSPIEVQKTEARSTRSRKCLFNYTQLFLFLKSQNFGKYSHIIFLYIIGYDSISWRPHNLPRPIHPKIWEGNEPQSSRIDAYAFGGSISPLSFSFMAEALMRMSASTSLSLYYVYNETSAGHAIW